MARRPRINLSGFHHIINRGVNTQILQGVMIENMSFERLIKEYDSATSFFYCDPPYIGTENHYKNTGGFGKKEHELLADKLSPVKVKP